MAESSSSLAGEALNENVDAVFGVSLAGPENPPNKGFGASLAGSCF